NLLTVTQLQFDEIEAEVDDILDTLDNGYTLYASVGPRQRRTMNRSVFERLWITHDCVVAANLMPGFAHVAQDDLGERLEQEQAIIRTDGIVGLGSAASPTYARAAGDDLMTDEDLDVWLARELDFATVERPYGPLAREETNPDAYRRQGSNDVLLVRPPGLEPGTCRLRV
ncbi:MAG: hypothetical protein QOI08_1550, partial [Actinomycetota bacterium]|nr:hypothetical protein [Actinomycetota bacterium]